jgi:hypothetical protein
MSVHAPGFPFFLARQAVRLGFSQELAYACRHSAELKELSTLIGGIDAHLDDPHRPGQRRDLLPYMTEKIKASLACYEIHHRKLQLQAAAADDMIESAYKLFGIERPRRTFELLSDSDFKKPEAAAPPPSVAEPAATDEDREIDSYGEDLGYSLPDQ